MQQIRQQSGFALLIFVISLLTLTGILGAKYLQSIKKETDVARFEKNKRILEQAKEALLMYAYNYPDFNSQGPGHLPCPYDTETGYSGALSTTICESVGRLPYLNSDLNFYEAKDSGGEKLWYAVSKNFYNFGSVNINSSTLGTLSVYDQSKSLAYDGTNDGVVAVIIAPGAPIGLDYDADGSIDYFQKRQTASQRKDPKNYLDVVGASSTTDRFNNADFINGSSSKPDSFILGPINDNDSKSLLINDQFIVITAGELLKVAEKSVLQHYQTAIRDFKSETGNYPWLFDFSVTDLGDFPGGSALAREGRIPSTFTPPTFFSEDTSVAYDSEIYIDLTKNYQLSGITFSLQLEGLSSVASDVQFLDDGTLGNNIGLLTATSGGVIEVYEYFWDDFLSPDGWEKCPFNNGTVSDCNRDSTGNIAVGSSDNEMESIILKVGLKLDMSFGDIELNYATPPTDSYLTANSTHHAFKIAEFSNSSVNSLPIQFYYEKMNKYDISYPSTAFSADSSGTQNILNNTDFGDISNQSNLTVKVGVRYYPALPSWAAPVSLGGEGWAKQVAMAISDDSKPSGVSISPVCSLNCLTISDMGGTNNNITSLLAIGRSNDLIDESNDGFTDDLLDIFDPENVDSDDVYLQRSNKDQILIIEVQ